MAHELNPEERETVISMAGDDHDTWIMYSDDPYWQRRIEKLGIQPFEARGAGRKYRLRAEHVLIRRGKPAISEQTRQARAHVCKLPAAPEF